MKWMFFHSDDSTGNFFSIQDVSTTNQLMSPGKRIQILPLETRILILEPAVIDVSPAGSNKDDVLFKSRLDHISAV